MLLEVIKVDFLRSVTATKARPAEASSAGARPATTTWRSDGPASRHTWPSRAWSWSRPSRSYVSLRSTSRIRHTAGCRGNRWRHSSSSPFNVDQTGHPSSGGRFEAQWRWVFFPRNYKTPPISTKRRKRRILKYLAFRFKKGKLKRLWCFSRGLILIIIFIHVLMELYVFLFNVDRKLTR